jgi:tetratricopeptide (TPR) repeat protein
MVAGLYITSLNKWVWPIKTEKTEGIKHARLINDALRLLKFRKDKDALDIFEKILISQPGNLDALWGKAEVLRRSRDYKQAETILNEILKKKPKHQPSLVSLAHLRYKEGKLNEALSLISLVLNNDDPDKDNAALAYIILGAINSSRAEKGGILDKIRYGVKIKRHFLKAKELVPDLPEARLALGTFYLLAPAVIGGNLDEAIKELEFTVKIAPDFATADARLAQAYKKKGDLGKYNLYIQRAKKLDPENEVLKEIKDF